MSESYSILNITGPSGAGKSYALMEEAAQWLRAGYPPERIVCIGLNAQHCALLTRYFNHIYFNKSDASQSYKPPFKICAWNEFLYDTFRQVFLPDGKTAEARQRHLSGFQTEFLLERILKDVLQDCLPQTHPLCDASVRRDLLREIIIFIRMWEDHLESYAFPDNVDIPAQPEGDIRLFLIKEVYRRFLQRCNDAGLVPFSRLTDVLYKHLTENKEFVPPFSVLLVNETHTLSPAHYRLLSCFLPGCKLVLAGNLPEELPPTLPSPSRGEGKYIEAQTPAPSRGEGKDMELPSVPLRWGVSILPWQGLGGDKAQEKHLPARSEKKAQLSWGNFPTALEEVDALAREVRNLQAGNINNRPDIAILLPRLYSADGQMLPFAALICEIFQHQGILIGNIPATDVSEAFKQLLFQTLNTIRLLKKTETDETQRLSGRFLNHCLYLWLSACPQWCEEKEKPAWLSRYALDAQMEAGLTVLQNYAAALPGLQDWLERLALFGNAEGLCTLLQMVFKQYGTPDIAQILTSFLKKIEDWENDFLLFHESALTLPDALDRLLDERHGLFHLFWRQACLQNALKRESSGEIVLLTYAEAEGAQYPIVFLPGLTEEALPGSRIQLGALDGPTSQVPLRRGEEADISLTENHNPLWTAFLSKLTMPAHTERQTQLFTRTLSCAGGKMFLSAHHSAMAEMGGEASPKIGQAKVMTDYIEEYCAIANGGTSFASGNEAPMNLYGWSSCQEEPLEKCMEKAGQNREEASERESPEASGRHANASAWIRLARQPEEPIWEETETLPLSPSRLDDYMQCPQRFYYRHVLSLAEESPQAAQMGLLVHRLMEAFHKNHPVEAQTAETLRNLANALFYSVISSPTSLQGGSISPGMKQDDPSSTLEQDASTLFDQQDIQLLKALDPVRFLEIKKRVLAAVDDLEKKGYFQTPIRTVLSEYTIQQATLPGLDRCRFNVTIDALREHPDGTWEILDYKYYSASRFNLKFKLEKLQERLTFVFTPLSETAETHAEKFSVTEAKPRLYQLPLYYLLLRQVPDFAGKVRETALQLIRPALGEANGAIRINLPPSVIEAGAERLIEDIRQHFAEPILAASQFSLNPPIACSHCTYLAICPVSPGAASGDADSAGSEGADDA